jgi:hypothetical protein
LSSAHPKKVKNGHFTQKKSERTLHPKNRREKLKKTVLSNFTPLVEERKKTQKQSSKNFTTPTTPLRERER